MNNKLRVTGSELIQDPKEKLARIQELAGISKPKQFEAKQNTRNSTVLHEVVASNGVKYGICQEGGRVYIKEEVNGKFEYIGGVANITENSHTSYASALKHLNLNLKEINVLSGNKTGTEILKKK
jgi:hypothetical protein